MGLGNDGAANAAGTGPDSVGISLDRSKVHVLLCDKDPTTGRHVMRLLQQCSYQVTCVNSAGQVIEILDSGGYEVDIILTEVELPKEKGFKMLKHIVRQEQLRRIPVVMMSVRDEMALVVKCLRLGAVDFLLKPLRTNELLNLWTHTWRRRRMLGLTEKHLTNGNIRVPFDLLLSETSESNNTNSTNLFSDDTDDLKKTISTCGGSNLAFREMESEMSPHLELSLKPSVELGKSAPELSAKTGWMPSPPKKSELKLGQSSAFLTYDKASNRFNERSAKAHIDPERGIHTSECRPGLQALHHGSDDFCIKAGERQEFSSSPSLPSVIGSQSAEPSTGGPSCVWDNTSAGSKNEADYVDVPSGSRLHPSLPSEQSAGSIPSGDQFPFMHLCGQNERVAVNAAPMPSIPGSQYLVGRVMGSALPSPPSMLPPNVQLYHNMPRDDGVNIVPGIPSMQGVPAGLPLTTPFSYYPYGFQVAAPQMGSFPGWPHAVPNPMIEHKIGQAERREAALNKFRRKRKDRCFEKKIRYVSRKKLAEQRPRIRGQFVRRANGMDANDNGVVDDYDDDDDDDGFNDLGSSPESIAEDA